MAVPHRLFVARTHREEPSLYIGKVAQITGASRKAIRHYEELGLLPAPARRGKYRVYSERDVFLVHVLKHAQSFGFQLSELKGLVDAKVNDGRFPLDLANELFDRKRAALALQIEALRELDGRLVAMRVEMNERFG
jgi:DNA-binding transcriptional MerR regulator